VIVSLARSLGEADRHRGGPILDPEAVATWPMPALAKTVTVSVGGKLKVDSVRAGGRRAIEITARSTISDGVGSARPRSSLERPDCAGRLLVSNRGYGIIVCEAESKRSNLAMIPLVGIEPLEKR